jgi:DNA-directed RNA polymerase II subunit RPB2
MTEADGSIQTMFPQEARIRNLTYASPLYVDISKRTQIAQPYDPSKGKVNPNELFKDEPGSENPPMTKVFIGKVKETYLYMYIYVYIYRHH